jgi:hypothetical protein
MDPNLPRYVRRVPDRHDEGDLDRFGELIDRWAAAELASNPMLLAVDHVPAERRWYLRMKGEEKDYTTVWLTLKERTLHHETYVLPAPEENHAAVYEYLLRANRRLYGMAFAIGAEDGVYLRGQVPLAWLDDAELDRIVGSSWQWSEDHFRPALHLAFASHFRAREKQ